MSAFEQIKEQDQQYVLHTYGRFPVAVASGKNATCVDFDGKEYIDMTSGIGVNSLGFCDGEWVAAVTAQLHKLQHISNLYYTEPCVALAQLLCEKSGMKKVFFSNSGAESNEGAVKAARKYSFDKYGPGRNKIITLVNSFHGRTVTTLAATGQDGFHNYFYPFTEGFDYALANDMGDLKDKLDDTVCAVMIEFIQGEGGVMPLEQAYIKQVSALCDEHDLILIADEVQTGIGRTGTFFAYEQFGVVPDVVTCAKGIGGGLPLGAILFGEKVQGSLGMGDHGSTYGGNPIACAGAKAVLARIDDDFLKQVKEKGTYITSKILKMPHVQGVDGMGMMLGVRLEDGITAADVVRAANNNGVLLLTAKTKVRLLPPLTITYEEIDKGLAAMEKTLEEV